MPWRQIYSREYRCRKNSDVPALRPQAEDSHTRQGVPFYECEDCGAIVRAEKTCCVFYDYGDEKCPTGSHEERRVLD